MDQITVLVDLGIRGAWHVALLPGRRERVTCESLEEAPAAWHTGALGTGGPASRSSATRITECYRAS
jgi:hypothetical protein